MTVRLFLRQDLYVPPGDAAHLPRGVAALDGTLVEINALGAVIEASALLSEKMTPLVHAPVKLLVPAAKIDHLLYR